MTDKGFAVFNTWKHVAELRERQRDCDDYPVLSGLEGAWAEIEHLYEGLELRDGDPEKIADSPVDALCYMIESGFYPPPELLLALADCFRLYESGDGVVELEEAFYGPRKNRVGNHAARRKKLLNHMGLGLDILASRIKDQPLIKAAEEHITNHSLDIDPESLLRSYRRFLREEKQARSVSKSSDCLPEDRK
tara:strand:+ start:1393 stop:1968 length:576 start_codon:yes stop_codon:yes gene_type:complete